MPTEPELLQAVLDDPDNDAPRLAYADWCAQQPDEATQARAEFIRAQIALANLGKGTPIDQEYNLRYRSERLTSLYGPVWGQTVAALVENYQFDRGFVELARLSARAFLDRAAALFSVIPLRHLDLTEVRPVARELFESPHWQPIRSLDMEACGLQDGDMALLAAAPSLSELRWLCVPNNQIGLGGCDSLATSPCLKNLTYAYFLGNPFQPDEEYSYDNGFVVYSELPDDGALLEGRHGPLRWLHHAARTAADAIPNRFRI